MVAAGWPGREMAVSQARHWRDALNSALGGAADPKDAAGFRVDHRHLLVAGDAHGLAERELGAVLPVVGVQGPVGPLELVLLVVGVLFRHRDPLLSAKA